MGVCGSTGGLLTTAHVDTSMPGSARAHRDACEVPPWRHCVSTRASMRLAAASGSRPMALPIPL